MKGEYTFNARELWALALVVLALLIVVFFLGVTVGERHERARLAQVEEGSRRILPTRTETGGLPPTRKAEVDKAGAKVKVKAEGKAKSKAQVKTSVPPKVVLKKGYYIQVGAFKDKSRAEGWWGQLKKKGYRVLVLYSSARGVYRVVVGPYSSKELAVRVARKVDRVFKVRSSVVPDSKLR